jgi:hypothetical protein
MTRLPSRGATGAAALLLIVTLASPLPARPGRVVAPDGKTLEGDVTENPKDNSVEIVSGGRTYKFNKAALKGEVEYDDSIPVEPKTKPQPRQPQPPAGQQPRGQMSAEEEFEKRRAALAPTDVRGHVGLARTAFDRGEYEIARDLAQEALKIDPRNQEAQDLLRTIDAQRKLNRRPPPGRQPPQGGQNTLPPNQAPNARAEDMQNPPARRPQQGGGGNTNSLVPPLSPDEVNRVRVLEWRGDRGVRIRLMNDVKRRYLARADMQPAEFNKLDAVDQAWEIRQKGSDELLNDVRITNDPPAMHEYRTLVQRQVLATCATAACHGGGAGSERFSLHPKADKEAEAYANFLTLDKYVYKPEKGREASMIDRNRPEDSLLIQFGLPPDVSNMPHPQVEGFRPLFRTVQEPRYRQFVRWIADSLSPLREDYGVPFNAARGAERPAGARQPAAPEQPAPEDPADAAPPAGQQGGALPGAQQPAAQPPAGGNRPPQPPQRPGTGR